MRYDAIKNCHSIRQKEQRLFIRLKILGNFLLLHWITGVVVYFYQQSSPILYPTIWKLNISILEVGEDLVVKILCSWRIL